MGSGAVGYAVRGQSKQSSANSLLFCTVGVLLRILEKDPSLAAFDYVIVDEVHERSIENDLLLMALRRILVDGASRAPHVCMMSATVDGDLLARYFASTLRRAVPRVRVGGRSFPVEVGYLEDALHLTKHTVRAGADWSLSSEAARRRAAQMGRRLGGRDWIN